MTRLNGGVTNLDEGAMLGVVPKPLKKNPLLGDFLAKSK